MANVADDEHINLCTDGAKIVNIRSARLMLGVVRAILSGKQGDMVVGRLFPLHILDSNGFKEAISDGGNS
ncbi:hypothetical protein KIN20_031335 [Parelaphostrongylus tenuis]|uniref:Uncharacterized protein n=1 Tax=Parelaphostrongylus tenuis TaxID=148309 RepID=A0AAD5R502_PARTN|nr:hypothetical protein KIN20_031335 [Parelaphostrongylus tenuis]